RRGADRTPGRPRGAAPLPELWLRPRPCHHLPGRAPPRRRRAARPRGRARAATPVLALPTGGHAPLGSGRGGGAPRPPHGRRARAPGGGRAGRRLPERRHRFLGRQLPGRGGQPHPAAHLLRDLPRGPGLRRGTVQPSGGPTDRQRPHGDSLDPCAGALGAGPALDYLDEPFADPSLLPCFEIAREARRHVKVVLSGDGADELFGGYTKYLGEAYAARAPRPLIWLLAQVSALGPSGRGNRLEEAVRQLRRLTDGGGIPDTGRRYARWAQVCGEAEVRALVPDLSGERPASELFAAEARRFGALDH